MRIYGAGMAGLLAAHMLRRFQPVVHEAQSSLPNNHDALLRFRTDAVSRATAIPFRKVRVSKAIKFQNRLLTESNLQLANLYSRKVTGLALLRSIESLEPVERYIAPLDFIHRLATGVQIEYNSPLEEVKEQDEPTISTIPMPIMAGLAKQPATKLTWLPIWSATLDLGVQVDVHQTIYYPDHTLPYYRASITGSRLILEFIQHADFASYTGEVLNDFGLGENRQPPIIKAQKFGKLLPAPDDVARKRMITFLTDNFNIYSVGRFATWRQILLDDVVHDVEVVDRFLQSSRYDKQLFRGHT